MRRKTCSDQDASRFWIVVLRILLESRASFWIYLRDFGMLGARCIQDNGCKSKILILHILSVLPTETFSMEINFLNALVIDISIENSGLETGSHPTNSSLH